MHDDGMMPNMDPRAMKNMLAKMGIRTQEVDALRVVIECGDKDIVVDSPQVTRIEAQGTVSFQVAGSVSETPKTIARPEITEEDIKLVMEKSGVKDEEEARAALEGAGGDIAEAILNLTGST